MIRSAIAVALTLLFLQSTAVKAVDAVPVPVANAVAGAQVPIVPAAPQIAAKAFILLDAYSGKVIIESNADQRLAPASLTKMMTGYVLSWEVANGKVKWSDLVRITPNSWAQNPLFVGSSLMWVDINADVSLKDLNSGLVISSGNDASVAIAEHLAGSEDSFADMMNVQAKRLGMKNTHFVNAHGLPDPQHYTTARDLAILAQAMIRDHPADYAVYAERYFNYNNIRQMNRNELLGEPGVDGIKTGHTEDAGYCLVSSAERDGMRLIAVVLGSNSRLARTEESRKMLGYGFRFYETRKLFSAGQAVQQAKVWGGAADSVSFGVDRDVYVTIQRGRFAELKANSSVESALRAPVAAGSEHGTVVVKMGEEEVLTLPLKATSAVERGGFFHRLWDALTLFFLKLFGKV